MLDLSLGEFQALATKALRGVGHPWGLAEEGGAICRMLATWGINPAENLTRLLTALGELDASLCLPDASWGTASGVACPMALSASLSDLKSTVAGLGASRRLPAVLEPLFLLPGLAGFADGSQHYVLWCDQVQVAIGADGPAQTQLVVDTPLASDVALVLTTGETAGPGSARSTRVAISVEQLEALEHFSAQTYAPATEASRAKGAG